MSSRAIRALRGDEEVIPLAADASDSEEEVEATGGRPTAFAAAILHDDDDSSSEEGDEEEEPINGHEKEESKLKQEYIKQNDAEKNVPESEPEEEDLDALLNEFQERDEKPDVQSGVEDSWFGVILEGLDPRDMDIDYSIRNSLLGNSDSVPSQPTQQRKNRLTFLFGPARDGWVKPPHYVGGGIGMTTYDRDPRSLPWPYNGDSNVMEHVESNEAWTDRSRWFTFMHSDSHQQDCDDYRRVQQIGDLNALIMFVTHHPFVTEALLQLTTVLYQTNHSHEGLSLLRRALWIYEVSSLSNFTCSLDAKSFMDVDQVENAAFFKAIFLLRKVSFMAGLPRTALALARFTLSLDPLRDPMGVLVAVDHYALAANSEQCDNWLVHLVESGRIQIWYRDVSTAEVYHCGLLEMPNWLFSYALALFRLYSTAPLDEAKRKADMALQEAMRRFPSIVGLLLQHLEVDTAGRSFRRDWVTVLDYATNRSGQLLNEWSNATDVDTVVLSATLQACELVTKIFVQQNARLWSDDDILQWLYDNLEEMQSAGADLPKHPSPALMRYAGCDLTDYENKIQTLPADANVVDAGLIAQAMNVDTNRPRFLRHMPRDGRGEGLDEHDPEGFLAGRPRIGGPPMQVIDPDWPLVEVFWRSFLPWNHVDQVPPPNR